MARSTRNTSHKTKEREEEKKRKDKLSPTTKYKKEYFSKCGRRTEQMLSAVENHFGPNRSYASGAHHYSGNSGTGISANTLTAPCPIIPLANPMATAEFARPHPKPNR